MPAAAVFLDRDGTLMVDGGFVGDPTRVALLPTVAQALRRLTNAGYDLIVVSNQSGVARGYFDISAVRRVEFRLVELLADQGAQIDAFYVCPHLDSGCFCRKPRPGLLAQAARERKIDLARSFMIGDRGSDISAGQALGLPSLLVLTGRLSYTGPVPDMIFPNLDASADWILPRGA